MALGAALGLTAAEGLARLVWDEPEPGPFPSFHRRVTRVDALTAYVLRPGLDTDFSELRAPDAPRKSLRTDAEGRRAPSFEAGAGPAWTLACLGDSSTMGWFVDGEEAWPYRLGVHLADAEVASDRSLRVENWGVHGYTSRLGREQWERDVSPRRPELVILAFGYNDSFVCGRDERRWLANLPSERWLPFHRVLEATSLGYRHLRELVFPADPARAGMGPRVGREGWRANTSAMLHRARELGCRPILLDLSLPNAYLAEEHRRLAEETNTPLVVAREVLAEALRAEGRAHLPLEWSGSKFPVIRFRWRSTRQPVVLFTSLADPQRSLQTLTLVDDGTLGDEQAADGIWTVAIPVPAEGGGYEFLLHDRLLAPAPRDPYVELNMRLSRRLHLAPGDGFDGPIWDEAAWSAGFAELTVPEESVHPSPRGQDLIARALARVVLAESLLRGE